MRSNDSLARSLLACARPTVHLPVAASPCKSPCLHGRQDRTFRDPVALVDVAGVSVASFTCRMLVRYPFDLNARSTCW